MAEVVLVHGIDQQHKSADKLEADFEGKLDLRGFLRIDPTVRNGYESIPATTRVKANATEAEIEELVRMARRHSRVRFLLESRLDQRPQRAGVIATV